MLVDKLLELELARRQTVFYMQSCGAQWWVCVCCAEGPAEPGVSSRAQMKEFIDQCFDKGSPVRGLLVRNRVAIRRLFDHYSTLGVRPMNQYGKASSIHNGACW